MQCHIIREKFDNTINDVYYVESYKNNKYNKRIKIVHLFMAKEGSEAGNFYNKSTIEYLRDILRTNKKAINYDVIERFEKYFALSSRLIKEESIEYNENERKITIKQHKPIKLKDSLIDEIEILDFCKNIIDIIEPNFDCQIKKDKMIIRIELPGEVLDFKSRINHIRGFYYFKFKGTIKFPESEDLCFKKGNMKDGEFRLFFTIIPINEGKIINNSDLRLNLMK
jgi:hypothetical protein